MRLGECFGSWRVLSRVFWLGGGLATRTLPAGLSSWPTSKWYRRNWSFTAQPESIV